MLFSDTLVCDTINRFIVPELQREREIISISQKKTRKNFNVRRKHMRMAGERGTTKTNIIRVEEMADPERLSEERKFRKYANYSMEQMPLCGEARGPVQYQ